MKTRECPKRVAETITAMCTSSCDRRLPDRSRRGRGVGYAVLYGLVALLGAEAVGAQQRAAPQGILQGRVLDQESGRSVRAAEIALEGTGFSAVTDDRGEFRIDPVRAGVHILVTRRIGYEERSDTLEIPAGALVDVTVELSTDPVELEGLDVVIRSVVLERHGFYAREEQGYGAVFIDRQTIVDQRPSKVTDLFRNITGLRVVWGGIYGARIFINQRITFSDEDLPGCEPSVWLDGIRSTMRSFDVMRVEELEGVEVYARGGAPGKFVDPCGTVVFWTRQRVR